MEKSPSGEECSSSVRNCLLRVQRKSVVNSNKDVDHFEFTLYLRRSENFFVVLMRNDCVYIDFRLGGRLPEAPPLGHRLAY